MVQTPEEQLLERVERLDPRALSEVHAEYYARIFRYVALRVSDEELAEDLTSEVFLRFLEALSRGRPPQQTLRGWLYGTAAHVVADHHRRLARHPTEALSDRAHATSDAALDPERIVGWAQLRIALLQLTEDQREIVAMRFGLDLSIRDVAEATGKSEGAVKQLQARAIARLGELLTGLHAPIPDPSTGRLAGPEPM